MPGRTLRETGSQVGGHTDAESGRFKPLRSVSMTFCPLPAILFIKVTEA